MLYFKDKKTHTPENKGKERHTLELKIYFSRISSQSCRKKRAKFVEIKKSLKHLRNIYAMLYPPRLQVAALGETHFFNTPNEALAWLEKQRDSIALDPS